MDTYKYQQEVKQSMKVKDFHQSLSFASLGIASETGKVMEIINRYLYTDNELNEDKFIEIMGDLFWNMTALCNTLYIPIEDIINRNVGKMRDEKYCEEFAQ